MNLGFFYNGVTKSFFDGIFAAKNESNPYKSGEKGKSEKHAGKQPVRIPGCCLLACLILLCAGCNNHNDVELADPTTTYSIIKADSNSGITIVSETESNPMKVRNFIDKYVIPEKTFSEKKSRFYEMLDHLKQLSAIEENLPYNEIDSLNYMAIHYLTSLLEDKQCLQSPIKHNMLRITVSPDKRMKIYSWNENIGFETNSFINVFQYHWKNGTLKAFFNHHIDSDNELNTNAGKIDKIFLLPSADEAHTLYLQLMSGTQGSNCYKGASMIRVTPDTLLFDQPLTKDPDISQNSMVYHYLQPNSLQINYNTKQQNLTIRENFASGERDSVLDLEYHFDGTFFQKITE